MGSSNRWSQDELKEAWTQMFSYSFYQNHYENIDVQCILMLLEGGLSHVKKLATAYSALKASETELVVELEKKTHECWTLKEDVERLGKTCGKCKSLEESLLQAKRRAKETQMRMDSIANILKLGDNFEPSQNGKRSAALDLVSQMILGSSPPSKRKKKEKVTPRKEDIFVCDTEDITMNKHCDNGIIPATVQMSPRLSIPPESPKPLKNKLQILKVTRSPVVDVNFPSPLRPALSKSCDLPPSASKTENIKKNLSVDLDRRNVDCPNEVTPEKGLDFDLKQDRFSLDATLKDYVKESTGKLLDNIWFSDDEDDENRKKNPTNKDDEVEKKLKRSTEVSPAAGGVIEETPRPKSKISEIVRNPKDSEVEKNVRQQTEVSPAIGGVIEETPRPKSKIIEIVRNPKDSEVEKKMRPSTEVSFAAGGVIEETPRPKSKLSEIVQNPKDSEVEKKMRPSTEVSSTPGGVIEETPCSKSKMADFWVLKEKRGPGEFSKSTGRKMRQMKLELGFKKVEKKVDLSRLSGGKRSLLEDVVDDEDDIIVASPGSQKRPNLDKYLSQESAVNTTDFRPLASSTQKLNDPSKPSTSSKPKFDDFDRVPVSATHKEPDYEYARGPVKKKSERNKLQGWDCKECAEYYSTMKHLTPSEIKMRMNACSRHRNKFKPRLNNTPPGFWNPLLPDTQECKGYTSICENEDS